MKRIISLFTILCCVLTFVSFPVMAEDNVQATSVNVVFSDNFQNETGTEPTNWQIYSPKSNGTIEVKSEGDNKFLRLQTKTPRITATNGVYVFRQPHVITKENLVNIHFRF